MNKICLFFVALLIFTIANCDKNLIGIPHQSPTEFYSYTSYDSSGTAVVKGWFKTDAKDSINFDGVWCFKEIGHPENIGPQTGDGELVGGFEEDKVWINLNPQMKDNNVFLLGDKNENGIIGEWTWSTFSGPTSGGQFIAEKK